MKIVANFNGDALWGVVPYIHETLNISAPKRSL